MHQFSVTTGGKYVALRGFKGIFFHSKLERSKKQRQQRKLVVDTASGSIRLHRPLLFDPPWEKMKGTERGKKAKQGRTGTWKDGSKALRKCRWFRGEGMKGQVVVGHCAMAARLNQLCQQSPIGGLREQNRLWDGDVCCLRQT